MADSLKLILTHAGEHLNRNLSSASYGVMVRRLESGAVAGH
jgi:hypothetical protein